MDAKKILAKLTEHDQRFDRIDSRLDQMDAKFKKQDARLDKQDARRDKQDARLDKQDARLDKQDARLDKQDARLDKQDARLDKQDVRLDKQDARLDDFRELAHRIGLRLENVESNGRQTLEIVMMLAARDHSGMERKIENHEDRIIVLECANRAPPKIDKDKI